MRRRRFRIVTLALLVTSMIAVKPSVAAPSAQASSRSLAELIEQTVDTMPGEGSDAFVDGQAAEVEQAARAIELIRGGAVDPARAILDSLDYDLVETTRSPGQGYWVALEHTPCVRCWGTYVINTSDTARNTFVEVPHPLHDLHTAELGVEAFERTNAALLSMAGTHRFANGNPVDSCRGIESDMARNRHSLFMAVHRLAGEGTWALQYHGFADRDGYPDAVLSDGSESPPDHLNSLRSELTDRGISAGVFDGTKWTDLGATCNPQGEYSRASSGRFVHLEFRPDVRSDTDTRAETVDAVLAAFFAPEQPR